MSRLLKGELSEDEFLRARAFASAQAFYKRAGVSDFINALNESLAMGDWTDLMTFPERIEKVSMDDFKLVVKKYLTSQSRTVGRLVAV
jgi:predicted Zn-dependent peptidase